MGWLSNGELCTHDITGHVIGDERIYTRTLVLWAVGIQIDVDRIWHEAPVRDRHNNLVTEVDSNKGVPTFPKTDTPVIRMMCKNGHYKGTVAKRMNVAPFKSVLSMDIQYADMMPNIKISARNTIQITGCCSFGLLRHMLLFFVSDHMACGVKIFDPIQAGFIIDIVLSNLFFRLPGAVDRSDVLVAFRARNHPTAVACYERLTRDPSVTVKIFNNKLPNNDEIYVRWFYNDIITPQQPSQWQSITHEDVRRILPIRSPHAPTILCTTFRVFGSGSIVQVGRWPSCMFKDKQIIDDILGEVKKGPKPNSVRRDKDNDKQTKIPSSWFNRKPKH